MKYLLLLFAFTFHTIHSMEPSDTSDPEIIAAEGMTQLLRAVEADEFELAEALLKERVHILKKKYDINESNTPTDPEYIGKFVDGKTPLTLAIANNNPKMVKLLLRYGANPNLPNRIGWTPIHVAYYFNSLFLDQLKQNPQEKSNTKLQDSFTILELLFEHKGNQHQPITIGWQAPLEYASELLHNHDEIDRNRNTGSFQLEFAKIAKKHGYKTTQLISKATYTKILRLELLEQTYEESKGTKDKITETQYEQKKQQIFDDHQEAQAREEFNPEMLLNILTTIREVKLIAAKEPVYIDSDEEIKTIESSPCLIEAPKPLIFPITESLESSPYPDTDEYEKLPVSPKLNIKDKSSKFVPSKSKGTLRRALSSPQIEMPEEKHHHTLRRGLSFWEHKKK